MKRSKVAIIYRSLHGRVAGYTKNGQRLFVQDAGIIADGYWKEYAGRVPHYYALGWVDAISKSHAV